MFQLGKNKKGISAIIAYVLLISISIALSIMVFNWLKFYVDEPTVNECPEGVSIVVSDYICSHGGPGNATSRLNVTLKNKGRFTIDGFKLGVNDREGAGLAIYILNDTGQSIAPGASLNVEYNISNKFIQDGGIVNSKGEVVFNEPIDPPTLIEVQAFKTENGEDLLCSVLSSQVIDSCP